MSLVEEESDDEIFFGKRTLKEFKKDMFRNTLAPRLGASVNNAFDNMKTEPDASIKIIETHSTPNLRSPAVKRENATPYSTSVSPASNPETGEESFINLENKVSELCVDPRTSENVEWNNTLDIVNYILNNGKQESEHKTPIKNYENGEELKSNINENTSDGEDKQKSLLTHNTFKEIGKIEQAKTPNKDIKIKHQINEQIEVDSMEQYYTPVKSEIKTDGLATPSSSSVKLKLPVFKTPVPPSNKKPGTSAKKTPSRNAYQHIASPIASYIRNCPRGRNAYQHIASPIASYIRNCPQVPLVKDVHPKKPLPSSIPKFVKSQPIKLQTQNKENIDLPKVAYKSAKKTVLINVDEVKLPQSQWVKSTFPTPKVLKHEKREMNPLKKIGAKQEESVENLSCLQAEVSICTEKSAFKFNK